MSLFPPLNLHFNIQMPENCNCLMSCGHCCSDTVITIGDNNYINGLLVNTVTQVFDNRKEATRGIHEDLVNQMDHDTKRTRFFYLSCGLNVFDKVNHGEELTDKEYATMKDFADSIDYKMPLLFGKLQKMQPFFANNLKKSLQTEIQKKALFRKEFANEDILLQKETEVLLKNLSFTEIVYLSELPTLESVDNPDVLNKLFLTCQEAYRDPKILAKAGISKHTTVRTIKEDLKAKLSPIACKMLKTARNVKRLEKPDDTLISRNDLVNLVDLARKVQLTENYLYYLQRGIELSDFINLKKSREDNLKLVGAAVFNHEQRVTGIKFPFEVLLPIINNLSLDDLNQIKQNSLHQLPAKIIEKLVTIAEELLKTLPKEINSLLAKPAETKALDIVEETNPDKLAEIEDIYARSRGCCCHPELLQNILPNHVAPGTPKPAPHYGTLWPQRGTKNISIPQDIENRLKQIFDKETSNTK